MNNSILAELKDHVLDCINDGRILEDNLDDAHHVAFNEDYYIIGYYQADQWLKKHDVNAWEAIAYVIEQEKQHFGMSTITHDQINSESIVNLLVFFAGYEIDINEIFEAQ